MRRRAGAVLAAAAMLASVAAIGAAAWRIPPNAPARQATVPPPPALKAERYLALTMYHEARGQSRDAMRAVGWVVLNRARDAEFPDGIREVVVEPTRSGKCQFGWACGDLSVDPAEPEAWRQAEELAGELLFQPSHDPTAGALWFWESWRERPGWLGPDVRETLQVGGHSFFAPGDMS
ncbi:MAG TPA: cell wall hydrolase [Geminicoccus sp.]|uniref:cell wall hydrolase n=1 Tax=Geminicoccus sp. TaxID=2024832 RepID=UPI002BECFE48|nr:cell wall hydrolase [Geminicoccus sp.]HWL67536.1 cell wall hydrolase [Geminicoccus sp.]